MRCTNRFFVLASALLLTATACGSEGRDSTASLGIDSFACEPRVDPQGASCSWQINADGPVACSLSADGAAAVEIADCVETRTTLVPIATAGVTTVELTAHAGEVALTRSVTVDLASTRQTPPSIKSFSATPTTGGVPLDVSFHWEIGGTRPLRCELDFDGDGVSDQAIDRCTSSSVANHRYVEVGSHAARLVVKDGRGYAAERTVAIEVTEPRAPEIDSFSATPTSGEAPLDVAFAWSITNPDGGAMTCRVDFDGDGTPEETIEDCTSSSHASNVYAEGTFAPVLAVENGDGLSARATASIVATAAAPAPEPTPDPTPSPAVGDLSIARTEWGQSVIKSQLVLVGGKEVLLRAYVLGNNGGITGTKVGARVYLGSQLLGTLQLTGPDTAPTSVDTSSLSKQYTALVPAAWVAPGMTVVVDADPDDAVPETNESNNSLTLQPTVRETNPLPITAVPVVWSGKTGRVVDVKQRVTQLWPLHDIAVKTHAPYTYTPSGSYSWSELLSDLGALRRADGSSRYYVGFVPGQPATGTVGIGYVGSPTCAVKDDSSATPDIVAHELGHNFGLDHAPCGTTGDANYPYSNARLGTQGWDYVRQAIVAPTSAYDVMSYCDPDWVSDYNYEKVQSWLQAHPPVAPTAAMALGGTAASFPRSEAFVVSGVMTPGGIVLRPVQRLEVSEEQPEAGEYTLRAWTAKGETTVPLAFEELDHGEAGERHFTAVVPTGDESLLGIEILQDGTPIHEEVSVDAPASAPTVEDLGNQLEITWDASVHPWAAVAFIDAEGEHATLALHLRGGHAVLPIGKLASSGTFEVSVSNGLDARRFVFER